MSFNMDDAFLADFDLSLFEIMNKAMIPGLAIAIIRDGKLVIEKSYGVTNVDTNEPVTSETVFEAASLSKPVFAFAVMNLVDRGELDLDRPLIEYVAKEYITEVFLGEQFSDARIRQITARLVLSHQTGFPNWRGNDPLTIEFEPGERFQYSGEGFVYLQKVVEKITGLPLSDFITQEVFTPLGMINSGHVWPGENTCTAASPHDILMDAGEKRAWSVARAAASLHTTITDYAKFVVALVGHAGSKNNAVVEMLSPQVVVDPEDGEHICWGLGVGLQKTKEGMAFWHWGDNRNLKCFFMAFPDQGAAVVYFTNSVYGLTPRKEIVQLTLGGDQPIMNSVLLRNYSELDLLWMKFMHVLVTKNVDAAVEYFRQLSKLYPAQDIVPEYLLNRIGKDYASKKKYISAKKIFKLCAEAYPDSSDESLRLCKSLIDDHQP